MKNRQLKVFEIYLEKAKFDHFKWSKISKFSLSTMVANIQPSSKQMSSYPSGATDPQLMILWSDEKSLK